MIDTTSKITTTKSTRRRSIKKVLKTEETINGALSNGSPNHDIFDRSWISMNYSDYLDYRSWGASGVSLCDIVFGNSLYGCRWDILEESHRRKSGSADPSRGSTSSGSTEGTKATGSTFSYYKKFGFYWNVFPKTDYCYSPSSPNYQKEISPGIPVVPNLSRKPLASYIWRHLGKGGYSSQVSHEAETLEFSEKSLLSSTKCETGNSRLSNSPQLDYHAGIEARKSLLSHHTNNYVEDSRVSSWHLLSSSSDTSRSASWLPFFLFLLLLLPVIYYFVPGVVGAHQDGIVTAVSSPASNFLSWSVDCISSVLYLVKETLLFIPTIFLQVAALFTSNSSSPIKAINSFPNFDIASSTPASNTRSKAGQTPQVTEQFSVTDESTIRGSQFVNERVLLSEEDTEVQSSIEQDSLSPGHFIGELSQQITTMTDQVTQVNQGQPITPLQLRAATYINNFPEPTPKNTNISESLCGDSSAQVVSSPPVHVASDIQFPVVNRSSHITEEQLLALQTQIVEKLKSEMAGQNFITSQIERIEEHLTNLTEEMKKISSKLEGRQKTQYHKLEGEFRDLWKAVIAVKDQAALGSLATPSDRMVERAVAKYHADRTGKPDYALQSSGGFIVRVRCSQSYTKTTASLYILGIRMPWDISNGPETMLKPGVLPGECWAFDGSFAQVTIHLATKVKVTSFSLEHSPKELALHGHISSAPKDFSVWALEGKDDDNPRLLGKYTFLDNGESLQHFDAIPFDQAVELIELKIESNHGNPEYTCVYRIRVHGVPSTFSEGEAEGNITRRMKGALPEEPVATSHSKPYR